MLVEYLVGRDAGADPTTPSDTALAALQEAKKKPAKYKLAEVLANLVLNPDQTNSWNAVRSLRSIAATVVSFPANSSSEINGSNYNPVSPNEDFLPRHQQLGPFLYLWCIVRAIRANATRAFLVFRQRTSLTDTLCLPEKAIGNNTPKPKTLHTSSHACP